MSLILALFVHSETFHLGKIVRFLRPNADAVFIEREFHERRLLVCPGDDEDFRYDNEKSEKKIFLPDRNSQEYNGDNNGNPVPGNILFVKIAFRRAPFKFWYCHK